MLNFLHDIRNKITMLNAHTSRLSKKYKDDEIMQIKTTILRMNELINDAYEQFSESENIREFSMGKNDSLELREFVENIESLIKNISQSFPIEIKNQLETKFYNEGSLVQFNSRLLLQVLENVFDNSLKANSSKIIVRVIENGSYCIIELVDNGSGISPIVKLNPVHTVIPHGLGKKIIQENMIKMNAKVEWSPRMDGSGMIVRLIFPFSTQSASLLGS